ncbi:putative nuclease HARBI1 [Boleophthalmus pectinirostris]|uniref:putative nuclease HARBI1 n=1 Tax=Boleophthalmus pectinirostris TaxID=150288 RepID=UPI000A1C6B12|nr:putative nuclease HARBI1 [Boleophthalmus pectinirostris]XP_055008734.1 putative nuclease HARBI1 [Boleophthalmus pectinirostris]
MEYILGMNITAVKRRKERVHKNRTTYLALTEDECLHSLHLSREVVTEVCHLLADDLSSKSPSCPYSIPVAVRVKAALHFFATASVQNPLSSTGGISQPAVSGAIHGVSKALVRHAADFIVFPNTHESQANVKKEFKEKFGVPDVLGVVDCTHVVLRAPIDNAAEYINNERTHSINVQIICDASCKITQVYANFPATTPDATILEKSEIPSMFEKEPAPEGWLLGDTAYPLKTWLIPPFGRPKTKPELLFNIWHLEAFSAMDKTVGMLKKRFRCLDKPSGIQYSPQKVGMFFVASCVLHNMALRHGCLEDVDEDTIKSVRRLDNAMHLPLSDLKTDSAAELRRAQLAQEMCDHKL